jgi:ABC-type transporter Mla subunit MlaD
MSPSRGPLWDWVGLDALWQKLDSIEKKLDAVTVQAAKFWKESKERDMAETEEIANLVQQVQSNKDAVQSATTALAGYVAAVRDLSDQLAQAIANSTDVSPAIKAAADEIKANTDALQAAIPQVAQAIVKNTKAQ